MDRWPRLAVIAVFFAHGFLFASWTAHIPQLKQHLGLSDGRLGLVLLGAPVGSVLAIGVAARILPRMGSRRMVRLTLVGYCVSGPFIGLTGSFGTFFVAFLLWGFFQGLLDVSMNTQAIEVERFSGRVLMPGFHGSWSSGALVGAVIGASAVGLGVSLSEQLLVLAVPCLLVVGWLTTRMIPDRRVGDDPESSKGGHEGHHGVLQRELIVLGGIAFADMLCEGAAADWAAVYLHNSMHAIPLVAGMGFAIYAFAMLAVRVSGNRLFTRFAAHRLLPLLAVIATLGFAGGLDHRSSRERAGWIRVARSWTRKRHPDDPQGGRSGGQREHRKSGRLGGRLWLGRLRRGTGRDRRDRIIDNTPHRPVSDPRPDRHCRNRYGDVEGGAALGAIRWQGAERARTRSCDQCITNRTSS